MNIIIHYRRERLENNPNNHVAFDTFELDTTNYQAMSRFVTGWVAPLFDQDESMYETSYADEVMTFAGLLHNELLPDEVHGERIVIQKDELTYTFSIEVVEE